MDKRKIIFILLWIPIVFLAILNLLTVFTPEIGFDALWYHLTLPKLWLTNHQWFFKGGLLYYSVMPRLTETIYLPLIKFTGYIGPKFIQYLSAFGVCFLIWKMTFKLKISKILQLTAVSLFFCTWLVSWESGSAYIDLFRTFLETTALYFLVFKSKKIGGIFLGLSIGTKWLSLGTLAIYSLIFGPSIIIPALVIASPWFLISYHFTGNPVYPLFDHILHNSFASFGNIFHNLVFLPFILTFPFDDFLSLMVCIVYILCTFALFSREKSVRLISLVGILGGIFTATLNPPSSRYFLPFFPAVIISAVYLVDRLKSIYQKIFVILAIISSFAILSLRVVAFQKYIPFLTGKESQNSFLSRYSFRLPDTFIDSDGYVSQSISPNSKILIDKLHNLYYFPWGFDHTSWADTSQKYDYLITKGTQPFEINGNLLHTNSIGIQVYELTK